MKLAKRLFLLFAAGLFALSLLNYLEHNADASRHTDAPAQSSPAKEGYFVQSEGLRICIRPLSGGPTRYAEGICVSDLPGADREQLACGFTLPDDAALLALLEDYTG